MTMGCLFCGGDAGEPDHWQHCDGRQGVVEGMRAVEDALADLPARMPYVCPAPELDIEAARAARDEGIERVEAHATESFQDAALLAVYTVARVRPRFCVDDVWSVRAWWPETPDRRALGAVMQAAMRHEWIAPTPEFVNTAAVSRHSAPVRIWRSLIVPDGT